MNTWLIKRFVQNYEDVKNKKVRLRYGMLAAMAGVFCNLGLFLMKLIVGLISHSVSIISDSFNNLSDAASNFLVLFSYRLSSKPADQEHPFGHGRSEYLVSLFMAALILATAFELLSTSIKSILHPAAVHFEWWILFILLCTILIKFWLSRFHGLIGRTTNNMTVLASSQDARNDMIVTAVSVIAMVLSAFTEGISFDGIGGVIVSCFILYSGIGLLKEILSRLMGTAADQEVIHEIQKALQDDQIYGVHDLIIHDYGPGVQIGSAHVEMDASLSLVEAHEIVDRLEKEIFEQIHVTMTLHVDPVVRNRQRDILAKQIDAALKAVSEELSYHDLQIHDDTISFDVLVPFHFSLSDAQIEEELKEKIKGYHLQVTFDHGYVQGAL